MDTTFILQDFLKTASLGHNYCLKAFQLSAANRVWTIVGESKIALPAESQASVEEPAAARAVGQVFEVIQERKVPCSSKPSATGRPMGRLTAAGLCFRTASLLNTCQLKKNCTVTAPHQHLQMTNTGRRHDSQQVEMVKPHLLCPIAALSQGYGKVPTLPKPIRQGESCYK